MSIPTSTFATTQPVRYADARPDIFVRRDEIPGALLAAEADTLGWDCVNAVRLPQVNAVLRESNASPADFDLEVQSGWTISGKFGTWEVARGGSGSIVFLRVPLAEAHMTTTAAPNLDLTGGRVTISIKLRNLPTPPDPKTKAPAWPDPDGETNFLASDLTDRGEDDPTVVIQSISYGTATPTEVQKAFFQLAISDWFNANLAKFTYVFSFINVGAKAASGAFQWLMPTYTSYAYANGPTDEESYFGALNLTGDRSPEGLTNQLPPAPVPPGCDGTVLISNGMFLREMILPGLTKSFSRATVNDFDISPTGNVIESVNPITLDNIKIDLTTYTPELITFMLQIIGDELQINTETKVNISPGIDVFLTSTEYYSILLVDKPDGSGQTLNFIESRTPRRNKRVETATWVVVTEIIVGIIIGVVAAVIGGTGVISAVSRRIAAVIIISIVGGLAAAIPTIIAKVLEGKAAEALPPIAPFVMEASGNVEWPGTSGFVLKQVQLNGSLQLGGNLAPVPPGPEGS